MNTRNERTEKDIYRIIAELEKKGDEGDITVSEARRLEEARRDLREIHRAKWPHAVWPVPGAEVGNKEEP